VPGSIIMRLIESRAQARRQGRHHSAFPFEELLIRRDFALVGAPHLLSGRGHLVVAPLDLGSIDFRLGTWASMAPRKRMNS
jgi:hypothetical protein